MIKPRPQGKLQKPPSSFFFGSGVLGFELASVGVGSGTGAGTGVGPPAGPAGAAGVPSTLLLNFWN